jgi:hypothetical protein
MFVIKTQLQFSIMVLHYFTCAKVFSKSHEFIQFSRVCYVKLVLIIFYVCDQNTIAIFDHGFTLFYTRKSIFQKSWISRIFKSVLCEACFYYFLCLWSKYNCNFRWSRLNKILHGMSVSNYMFVVGASGVPGYNNLQYHNKLCAVYICIVTLNCYRFLSNITIIKPCLMFVCILKCQVSKISQAGHVTWLEYLKRSTTLTLSLLNTFNGLVRLSIWTKPFRCFR